MKWVLLVCLRGKTNICFSLWTGNILSNTSSKREMGRWIHRHISVPEIIDIIGESVWYQLLGLDFLLISHKVSNKARGTTFWKWGTQMYNTWTPSFGSRRCLCVPPSRLRTGIVAANLLLPWSQVNIHQRTVTLRFTVDPLLAEAAC